MCGIEEILASSFWVSQSPWFQYGNDLRLPTYCWDLVLNEADVEPCKQPLVSFGTSIIELFNQYIIYYSSFFVLLFTEWIDI